jgi:uncharacterized protein (TIGR02996 family)
MTHDEAFLQAIIENPDDDTPRLVYADWLDEHGQEERAEFIRVQCELARLTSDDPRRPKLKTRERELLNEHQREWAGPLGRWAYPNEFRRGFVEAITIRPAVFLGVEVSCRSGRTSVASQRQRLGRFRFPAGLPVLSVSLGVSVG